MEALLKFATELVEQYGLITAVWWLLTLGVVYSLIRFTFPTVFKKLGDIAATELQAFYEWVRKK